MHSLLFIGCVFDFLLLSLDFDVLFTLFLQFGLFIIVLNFLLVNCLIEKRVPIFGHELFSVVSFNQSFVNHSDPRVCVESLVNFKEKV